MDSSADQYETLPYISILISTFLFLKSYDPLPFFDCKQRNRLIFIFGSPTLFPASFYSLFSPPLSHIFLLLASPYFTPGCPWSLKKNPAVTGDSREELSAAGSAFLQCTSTRRLPVRVVFFNTCMRTHTLTKGCSAPTSQLYNYTVQKLPPAGTVYLPLPENNTAFFVL